MPPLGSGPELLTHRNEVAILSSASTVHALVKVVVSLTPHTSGLCDGTTS